MATVNELKALKKGDYIESFVYYKVLGANEKGIVLTGPFYHGSKPKSKWICQYNGQIAKKEFESWNVIQKDSKKAKGIERKLRI